MQWPQSPIRGSWRKAKELPHPTSHLSVQLTFLSCLQLYLLHPWFSFCNAKTITVISALHISKKKHLLFPTNNPYLHFPNACFLSLRATFPEFTLIQYILFGDNLALTNSLNIAFKVFSHLFQSPALLESIARFCLNRNLSLIQYPCNNLWHFLSTFCMAQQAQLPVILLIFVVL